MYRSLFQNAPDAMLVFDVGGAVVEANQAASRLFEIPRSGLLGRTFDDHRDRVVSFDVDEAVARLLGEGTFSGIFGLVSRKGAVRQVEFCARSGVPADHHLVVCRDVTERLRVERSLRLREAQLAQAQAIARLGHWTWVPGRRAIEVSEQALRIHGFEPGTVEPTTRLFRQALHPDDRQEVRRALWAAVRRRGTFSFDYRIVRSDGEVRILKQKGETSPGPDGKVRLLGVIRDITEDRQAEEARERALRELEAHEKMREEWTTVVAHDLRQPLTAISTQGQILARRLQQSHPELVRASEHILASAHLLNRMVGDLLDVSRIEARRLSLQCRPVSMDELARGVIERFCLEIDREVALDTRGPLPPVEVDPERFEQIFVNLLSNAVKYGTKTTPIRVALGTADGGLTIEVINEGKGIPAEELPRLFTRFHRAAGVQQSNVSGLGLGLYITRGLVEAHGGVISAESEPGGRTVFRIVLPGTTSG